MAYITVKYPETRTVFIDGEDSGQTNVTLRVEEGTHTFDLGVPVDYKPGAITVVIKNTAAVRPQEVRFEKA